MPQAGIPSYQNSLDFGPLLALVGSVAPPWVHNLDLGTDSEERAGRISQTDLAWEPQKDQKEQSFVRQEQRSLPSLALAE